MPHRPVASRHRRHLLSLTLLAGALFAGCATAPETRQTVRAQANPADRVQRTIISFTPALRCMDELMFRTGVRDPTLMTEELRDSTQRVHVGARDMMTSAVPDMARRSRAVRLSALGNDQAHLLQLLLQAQKGRHSVQGVDVALVDTRDCMLVPGASSKNTTVITRRDSRASGGQAQRPSTGLAFSFSAAARNLGLTRPTLSRQVAATSPCCTGGASPPLPSRTPTVSTASATAPPAADPPAAPSQPASARWS